MVLCQTKKLLHSKEKKKKKRKEITNAMKRQHNEWKKMFTNIYLIKGYYSKKRKQLNRIKNGQRKCVDVSPKKTCRWPVGHVKSCSTSLTIREIHINTTVSHHLTPVRLAIIEKTRVGMREPLCIVGGNVDWYSHYGKQHGVSSKN